MRDANMWRKFVHLVVLGRLCWTGRAERYPGHQLTRTISFAGEMMFHQGLAIQRRCQF